MKLVLSFLQLLQLAAPISPDDAVALAISRSTQLGSARLEVDAAEATSTAFILSNPEIQLGHRSLNDPGSVDPFDDSQVQLGWQPPALDDLGLSQASGARAVEARVEDLGEIRADIAWEVRLLYARVLALRAQHELATSRVALMEQVARVQASRVAEQVGTALDADLTALDVLDARAEAADARGDLERTEQRLASLLGLAPPLLLANDAVSCTAPTSDVPVLVAQAAERSPRLRAIKRREAGLDFKRTRAWLRFVPWFEAFQIGYLPKASGGEVRARMDISLPIFEFTNPRLRLIDIEEEQLSSARLAAERDLDEKVRAAHARHLTYVALKDVYAGAGADIERSQQTVARSMGAELFDTLKVASVQERVMRARRQALRASLACVESSLELDRLTGNLFVPPAEVGP